jgi:TM2 domain-containing membrane protein YozV
MTGMTGQPGPPAGWYPVGDSERFWDGVAWTENVRAPAHQGSGSSPSLDAHGLRHQADPWAEPAAAASAPPSSRSWPPPSSRERVGAYLPRSYSPTYGYVTAKNPGLSVLASFFLPGLGSIINGDIAKGIGIMVGYVVSYLLVIVLIGFLGIFGFWVWGLVDAYQGARLWNARHGIIS